MTPSVERILAEIRQLTLPQQQELRGLLTEVPACEIRPSARLINQVKGKYVFVPTSSEAFAARKHEEIDLEDRRFDHS